MLDIGAAIREVRGMLGLSQREAARGAGISHVHLSNLENGRSDPSTGTLEKICQSWGIDVYVYAAMVQKDTCRLLNIPESSQKWMRATFRREAELYCQEFARKTKAVKAVQKAAAKRLKLRRKLT